jgi:hypothetical protein
VNPSGVSNRSSRAGTLLQQYLDRNAIPSARLESTLRERLGGRAPDRKTMARWRQQRADIRRKDMVRILWALRIASGNPHLRMDEIFDLDPNNDDNWRD